MRRKWYIFAKSHRIVFVILPWGVQEWDLRRREGYRREICCSQTISNCLKLISTALECPIRRSCVLNNVEQEEPNSTRCCISHFSCDLFPCAGWMNLLVRQCNHALLLRQWNRHSPHISWSALFEESDLTFLAFRKICVCDALRLFSSQWWWLVLSLILLQLEHHFLCNHRCWLDRKVFTSYTRGSS